MTKRSAKVKVTKLPAGVAKGAYRSRREATAKVGRKTAAKRDSAAPVKGGSQFKGKKLFPKVEKNPRRSGSHGERSLGIIIAKPGITYAEFIRAGGRAQDLRWDARYGHVEARA
jgi:hypothetical protein